MNLKVQISFQDGGCSTFFDIFQHISPVHCEFLKAGVDVVISANRINFFLYDYSDRFVLLLCGSFNYISKKISINGVSRDSFYL